MQKLQEMQELQQSPIEFITFSGGGAKGAIYSGAYEALKISGTMKGVKALAGASAGSITAAVIATGITSEAFKDLSKNTSFKALLGTKGISIGPLQLSKDGQPLYEFVSKTIRTSILVFFKGKDIKQFCEQRKEDLISTLKNQELTVQERDKLQEQIAKIDSMDNELSVLKTKCEQNGEVTFKDLSLLRLLDPEVFKDLVITAVDKEEGKLKIFSNETTPDVEIALACRASSAIPLVFEPVKIDGVSYVDGGYMDNIPTSQFPEDKNDHDWNIIELDGTEEINQAKKQGRTFVLAFGSSMDDSANIAIWSGKNFDSPSAIIRFLVDVLFKMLARVGGTFKYTETDQKTMDSLREDHALNTVVLNTQGVGTLDFDDANEYAGYLHTKGLFQTMEYLDNHELAKGDIEHQKFLLNVYEIYDKENLNKTFGRKLLNSIVSAEEVKSITWQEKDAIKNHKDKAAKLLSFCELDKWRGRATEVMLRDYVCLASRARNNEFKADTKAMDSLVKALNEPTTPSKIKEDFIKLLDINQEQDLRFNKGKNNRENIGSFKFKKEDFQIFLDKNRNELLTSSGLGIAAGRGVAV